MSVCAKCDKEWPCPDEGLMLHYEFGARCVHHALERSCALCEMGREIEELRAEILKHQPCREYGGHCAIQDALEETNAALQQKLDHYHHEALGIMESVKGGDSHAPLWALVDELCNDELCV